MSLQNCLTESSLRTLAGDRWFARGRSYQQEGRVTALHAAADSVSARVVGTETYRVRLSCHKSRINYSCSCPVGEDGDFCKHCVAVGLAWLAQDPSITVVPARSQEYLQSFLEGLDQKALVNLILAEASRNRRLRDQLELEAARTRPSGIDFSKFKKAITSATRTSDIDYHSMSRFARRVFEMTESISQLLEEGHSVAVVELTEYFLLRLEKAVGEVDDSDGYFGELIPDLTELHHEACLRAQADPVKLAQRLFKWELESGWDLFTGAAQQYADVLGGAGLAEYRRLTEAVWSQVPQLKPGDDPNERWGNRYRITSMMEALAKQSNDLNALVEIKQRDLAHPYSFFQIAEIYREAKQLDKALDWAEKGAQAFQKVDSRISDFLSTEYHRRGRHREAMDLIWAQFIECPSIQTYTHLHANALLVKSSRNNLRLVESTSAGGAVAGSSVGAVARPSGKASDSTLEWSHWREQALRHIRELLPAPSNPSPQSLKISNRFGLKGDHALLVEIFLWEQNFEAAWDEAISGGCGNHLWLRLADTISKDHADRAYLVYKELIPLALKQTNNEGYSEAIELLTKMHKLTTRLDNKAEFAAYLTSVRVEYKRKRNFIQKLDRTRW